MLETPEFKGGNTMKHSQPEHRLSTDLVIEILLGIIALELIFGLFDPTFLPGLIHFIGFTIVTVIKVCFYAAVIIACFFIGRKLGDYLKTHLD